MDIDEQIDSVLNHRNSNRSRKHKHFWLTLSSVIVAVMIGTMLVFPIFDGCNGLDVLKSFFESSNGGDGGVGDQPIDWNWTIENGSVFINNSWVYLSASPHMLVNDGWVEFEFESKEFSGELDAIWGFNSSEVEPRTPQIWRNYTHNMTGWHYVEQYLNITFDNAVSYEVLDIADYDNYTVNYGNRNNTKLWNLTYNITHNTTDNVTIAFTTKKIFNETSIRFFYYDDILTEYYYDSAFWDWKHFNKDITIEEYDWNGFNKWYMVNATVQEDKLYRVRAWIDIPFGGLVGTSGKYVWAIKEHDKTMQEAIDSGRILYLDPWWNSSYNNYRKITIESDYIDSDLTNFPLLVVLDNSTGNFTFHNSGADIEFVSTDNATQINHEVEKFDNAGDTFCWVNISETLTSGSDYSFLVYYNNSDDVTVHYNPTDVWDSNYLGVYHLNESSGSICYDSTSNNNDGTYQGNLPNRTVGKVGYGQNFVADDSDYINLPIGCFLTGDDFGTIEAIVDYDVIASNTNVVWIQYASAEDRVYVNTYESDFHIYGKAGNVGQWEVYAGKNVGVNWNYLAYTMKKDDVSLWVDSIEEYTDTSCNMPGGSYDLNYIGANNVPSFFDGKIDEFRISDLKRSDAWIGATYHSTNQTTGFLTFGTEQTYNAPPAITGEVPEDTSIDINLIPSLNVTVDDADGDWLNVTWWSNSSGGWVWFARNSSIDNATFPLSIVQTNNNFSDYFTKYWWSVNVSDGIDWTNTTFSFRTLDNVTITLVDHSPINIRTNSSEPTWFVYNVTTIGTPINFWSIVWAYGVNHTETGTHNTSYSLEDHLAVDKLRGYSRNENITQELKFNLTHGDNTIGRFGEWNTHDMNHGITFVDSGANWTLVNATEEETEHLFAHISFVDEEEIREEQKNNQELDVTGSDFVKVEFNMSDTDWWNDRHYNNSFYMLHFFANETNADKPINAYFVNSSYTTGDIASSPYAAFIGQIQPDESYDYSEDLSSYYELRFSSSDAGFVGTVNMTEKFYIVFTGQGATPKRWWIHYADSNETHTVEGVTNYHDFNNRTIVELSNSSGSSWSANASTPDIYLDFISLNEEDASEVKLYANDTSGNEAWSSVHTDLIDITNYPPNCPDILSPNASVNHTTGSILNITYNWIGDPNFDTCWVNISYWNWNTTTRMDYIQNRSITSAEYQVNHSFYYNWDTIGVVVGNYTIAINVTDPFNLWCNASSEIFNITANNPSVLSGESPTNNSVNISLIPQLYVICTDVDDNTMTAIWLSNSSGSWVLFATNTSIITGTNITQPNSNFSSYSTKYWWSVNLSDRTNRTNETYSFTTVEYPFVNTPSNLTNEVPANASTNVQLYSQLNITVTDVEGNNSIVYWYTNASGDWYLMQTNASVLNTTVRLMNFTNASSYSTTYWWRVSANDTIDNTTEIYHFTTMFEFPITLTDEYPNNNSIIFSVQPTLYFNLSSPTKKVSYRIYTGLTNSSVNNLLTSVFGVGNGTYNYINYFDASEYGVTYYWRVHFNDSETHANVTLNFIPWVLGGGSSGGFGFNLTSYGIMGLIGGIIGLFGFAIYRRENNSF